MKKILSFGQDFFSSREPSFIPLPPPPFSRLLPPPPPLRNRSGGINHGQGQQRKKEKEEGRRRPHTKRQRKKKDFCPFRSGASAPSSQGGKGGRVNGGEDELWEGGLLFSHESVYNTFPAAFNLEKSAAASPCIHIIFLKNISHIPPLLRASK